VTEARSEGSSERLTGMPTFGKIETENQIWNLVDYLELIKADALIMRLKRPFIFTNLKSATALIKLPRS
jgi:hypothetical protein